MNVAVYYDDVYRSMTREQFIDAIQLQLETGYFRAVFQNLNKRQLRQRAAEMFEEQLKQGIIRFYGIIELPDLPPEYDFEDM